MSDAPQVLFKSDAVLVRLMTLQANEIGQKHYHSHLFETIICVKGEITLFVAGAERPTVLFPGQQASVASPHHHWVQNNGATPAQYVLAQNGGNYDFVPVT